MKNTNPPQETNTFKFQFTKLLIGIAVAIYTLCVLGIVLSIIRIVQNGIHGLIDVLQSPFLILICLFAIALLTAMLIHSCYKVTDTDLVIEFGFIKSSYPLSKITSILLDTDTHKLTIYMGEEYFMVTTNPEWNNDLVQAIRAKNPEVEFTFTLSDKQEKK